ncbi:MAG: hypothetical protein RQM92_09085 [Candidatus Syntrophopropionicum ammoniitolerans]
MKVHEEKKQLEKALLLISAKARKFNLDFYDMFFEICPADIIYTFGRLQHAHPLLPLDLRQGLPQNENTI